MNPKTVFEPYPSPQKAHRVQKVKNDPNPTTTTNRTTKQPYPKITRQGPKSLKMTPKSKISKSQKTKKSYKKLFRPHLSPKNNPIEHKKAENETKKTKQKNQKSENKKN